MRYVDYLCNVLSDFFNLPSDLVIVNDCRLMRTFSVFPIKIASSESIEQLLNITLIYGTICINGTYFFCSLCSSFSFAEIKHQMTKCISFSWIFSFNVNTFKICNLLMNLIKPHWNVSFQNHITMRDFSHVWNEIVCSKPSIEKCFKPLFQSIILGWVIKTFFFFLISLHISNPLSNKTKSGVRGVTC